MARIELDLPDDLLRQIDEAADRAGESRDEYLVRNVEEGVRRDQARLRAKLEEMIGPPIPMGGNAAEIIREMRDSWPPSRRGNDDAE